MDIINVNDIVLLVSTISITTAVLHNLLHPVARNFVTTN